MSILYSVDPKFSTLEMDTLTSCR